MNLRALLNIGFLLLLWGGVAAPVVPQMVQTWLSHSDNTHAVLVPFIALYLGWGYRQQLAFVSPKCSLWGGVLLVLSLVGLLLCGIGGFAFGERLMLVCSLVALIWAYMGDVWVRTLAFPLGFLFFMVPVPDTLLNVVSLPLQMQATKLSAIFINALSIPVYQEGNMLFFAQTQLEVAEACSGIRSIISLVMLSVLVAYFSKGGWLYKLVLVTLAIPIAMLANVVRVTGTGILAHYFGDKVARGFLHDFSGVVVFLFGLVVMLALSKLIGLVVEDRYNR